MIVMLQFGRDEIKRELPYAIIAETASRSVWSAGRRKRLWANTFNGNERKKCNRIIAQAKDWSFRKGVPMNGVTMSVDTYRMWIRLAEFCASI